MTKEKNIKEVVKYWKPQTIDFFFNIRNINGQQQVYDIDQFSKELVSISQTHPIVNPKITPFNLKNLTSLHLIQYFKLRDYTVLSNGRPLPTHPSRKESRSPANYDKFLAFALKDYRDNVLNLTPDELEDLEYEFGKVIKMNYKIHLRQDVTPDSRISLHSGINWFDEVDLDLILGLYCEMWLIERKGLGIRERKTLVEKTLEFISGRIK